MRKRLGCWRYALLSVPVCAVLVALAFRHTPHAGDQTADSAIEITISGHRYLVPKSYIAYYDGHREGEREGVLLRVALPGFTPWSILDAAERKSTLWAEILIEEGETEGYTDRVLYA